MKLEFISLSGPKLQENVYEVLLPTADGVIAIYPQHAPTVTTVAPGVIMVRRKKTDSNEQRDVFATNGGIAEISNATIRLLVNEADHADDLVESEVQEALARAKQLKSEAKDEVELERAEALIDRHAVRLKVAELRRNRKPRQ